MRRGLLVLAGMALAGTVVLTWGAGEMVSGVAGVEEARGLERLLTAAYADVVAPEPPPRVTRVPGDEGWSWRLEATLRPGVAERRRERVRDRVVQRALSTFVGTSRPAGVRVVFVAEDGRRFETEHDERGQPVTDAPVAPEPAPPTGSATPTEAEPPATPPTEDEPE